MDHSVVRRGRTKACRALLLALGLGVLGAAQAELPVETLRNEPLPAADPYRIYLTDPVMGHLVDGRVHVIDGTRMRYLGMTGAGFSATTVLSPDRKELFVATTYHSRLQRGTRTDVVEAWSTEDLSFKYEVEIPAKHAQGLQIKALMQTSSDGRFLLVQNATPATSVTVVDLQQRRAVGEIANPGCWGILPWRAPATRFSTVCGDGTLMTFDLDASGASATSSRSARFFDPDTDPVFMHYEMVGDRATFISYQGRVHGIELSGAQPSFAPPWPLLDAASMKKGWRPGGYEFFAIEPRRGRLFVAMHPRADEGAHKDPAQEIWVFDLDKRQRVARMNGHAAISMALARTETPRLFLLSGADNTIVAYDVRDDRGLRKPLAQSAPMGETPVYLETH